MDTKLSIVSLQSIWCIDFYVSYMIDSNEMQIKQKK